MVNRSVVEESLKLKTVTTGVLKGACDKAVLSLMKEITFSDCPKCGLHTLGTLDGKSFCVNCGED